MVPEKTKIQNALTGNINMPGNDWLPHKNVIALTKAIEWRDF